MLWVKSFHIIAVICWFASLFYLPRLFVYHAMVDSEDTISNERFKIMERKLIRAIGTPSMVATLVFGSWAASYSWQYYLSSLWFWIKILLVAALVAYHLLCYRYIKIFAENRKPHNHVVLRFFNEIPVLFLVVIVILVVVKPS